MEWTTIFTSIGMGLAKGSWRSSSEDRGQHLNGTQKTYSVRSLHVCGADVSRFSSWIKLLRATAWMFRFISGCHSGPKCNTKELQLSEIQEAEKTWWKQCQHDSFPKEIKSLLSGQTLHRSSRLHQLCPFLDSEGILRVKGRLQEADMLWDHTKFPPILDSKHPFVNLLIDCCHRKNNHQGEEQVVNKIHQGYWILKLRSAVRSAWNRCQGCKNRRVVPQSPQMGPLPKARMCACERPFSCTGIDYFGPMYVTVGRRHEKRYVSHV